MKKAELTGCFNEVYEICRDYILNICFGEKFSTIEDKRLLWGLKILSNQEDIIQFIAIEIGKATVENKEVIIKGANLKLSETDRFTWRRGYIRCKKTVFNFVATYNDFEKGFANFLDGADDVISFAALVSIFHIDYFSVRGQSGIIILILLPFKK